WAQRGVLHRLPRDASGAGLGGEVGLPLSRPALSLAAQAARHADPRHRAVGAGDVPTKPRSGRERRTRRAPASAHRPRPLPRGDRALVARAPDAAAVTGAGVLHFVAVALLRRLHARACYSIETGPRRITRDVHSHRS